MINFKTNIDDGFDCSILRIQYTECNVLSRLILSKNKVNRNEQYGDMNIKRFCWCGGKMYGEKKLFRQDYKEK